MYRIINIYKKETHIARIYLSDGETIWKVLLKFVVVALCSKTGSLRSNPFFLFLRCEFPVSLFLYRKYSIIYLTRISLGLPVMSHQLRKIAHYS